MLLKWLVLLSVFRDKTGQYEYEMAFDINMKDVTGQSALYLACYVGNQKLVDLLLKHRIQATKVKVSYLILVFSYMLLIFSIVMNMFFIITIIICASLREVITILLKFSTWHKLVFFSLELRNSDYLLCVFK